MASIQEYLAERHRAQDVWNHSNQENIHTITVGKHFDNVTTAAAYDIFSKSMSCAEVNDWMTRSNHSEEAQIALRVICIPRLVRHRTIDLRKHILEDVHKLLGHELARHMSDAVVSGLGCVQNSKPLTSDIVQYLSFHPSMTATWSQSAGTINMVCVADHAKLQALEGLLALPFVQDLMEQPELPLTLCTIILASEVDSTLEGIKVQVRQTEVRTGHHSWKSRSEVAALGDLIGLTAKMSGCSTRIGSCLRKQTFLMGALTSLETGLGALQTAGKVGHCQATPSRRKLKFTCDALSVQLCAQRTDTEFVQLRVKTQLDALYHLVAQNDALSAQEMAQDCRQIAVASRFDSSSMKCMALVTMFFLPGTFVSSLLSIPLFDWDADQQATIYRRSYWQPVLEVFFAITLPLMAVTFGVWAFWILVHRNRASKGSLLENAQLQFHITEDEVRALTSKRGSVKKAPQCSRTW